MFEDNIFYAPSLANVLQVSKDLNGGLVFACHVNDLESYVMFDFE